MHTGSLQVCRYERVGSSKVQKKVAAYRGMTLILILEKKHHRLNSPPLYWGTGGNHIHRYLGQIKPNV